jgi:AAA domain, putative AbiEii toxin, Type IV TA system/AAA ATPase domain
MHIERFRIQSFKCFEDMCFHLDPHVNVLTGVNNSGKTTVLEALALWTECFQRLLTWAGKADARLELRTGDLRFYGRIYLDQDKYLRSVRSHGESDLFSMLDSTRQIRLIAVLVEAAVPLHLEIGFQLRMARGGMLEARPLLGDDGIDFDYGRFNSLFKQQDRALEAVFASPVAALLFAEEFETLPKIRRHVRSRESMLVLRNRLYQLAKQAVEYQDFLRTCSQVLCGAPGQLELKFVGDEKQDVELRVEASLDGRRAQWRDLSLLGSGALQLIELMLALHSERRDLTLVLLDEPDSHLHRDLQRRMMDALRGAKNCQVFLTTHNESLLRSTRPEQIFHLEGNATGEERPIVTKQLEGLKTGLQPSPHAKVLQSLGNETALDFVNALEADRLVLVEGEDDALHLQAIVDLQKSQWEPFRGMYWAFGGIDEIFRHVPVYRRVFESIRNGGSLWDKAVLIFDRDCFPDLLRDRLRKELAEKLKIPVYVTAAYTLEATLLGQPEKLVEILTVALGRRFESEGKDEAVDRGRVGSLLDEAIGRHRSVWQGCLEGKGDKAGVWERRAFGQIKDHCMHLERSLGLNVRKGLGDAEIQPKVREYALDHLARGRVDHLTDKHEVLEIINEVARPFGVEFAAPTFFALLVQAAGLPSTWPDEWVELQQLLRTPPRG